MNRRQASEAAEELLDDIDVHYMAEVRKIQEEMHAQKLRVHEWLRSGAYRGKKGELPHIPTKTVQSDYGRRISETREELQEQRRKEREAHGD